VLVDRDDELRALSALASGVGHREGARLVVLTGEAGTGKSRLAREFSSSLPEDWSTRTVRITRTGGALPAVPEGRPLALVLDDAHFLEPAALESVAGLLNDLGSEAVLLLLTFGLGVHRAGSAEMRALAGLVRDPRAWEARLAPLSPAGIEQMAAAMGRYATEDLHRRTGGNPFWAEEVLRGGDRVPWTVVETVTAQLDALPAPARDLACALAVAEEPVSAATAAQLVDGLDDACAALGDTGLAQDDAAGVGLRHALLGDAVQARLGPTERAGWHRRLAAALEDEDVDRDRVARHWAAAGEAQRAAAIAGPAASDLRARGATRRAFECFQIAVRRPPADAEAAAALHEEAALTAARIGEHDAMRSWVAIAERLYRAAGQPDRAVRMLLDPTFDYLPIRRSDAIRDEPVERLLVDAQAAMGRGDPETARRLVDSAVEASRSRSDGMALARAARMVLFSLGEFERGEALLDEAFAFPDVSVHPGRESRILTIRACSRFAQGNPLEALELLRRGAAISHQEPEAVLWTGHLALADVLLLVGRVDEGASALADAGRARGAGFMVDVADGYRRFEVGDVEGGLAALENGTDRLLTDLDFDPLGRAVTASRILLTRALAEVHGGRPEAALQTVGRLDSLSPEPFNDVAADLAYVLARGAAAVGNGEVLAQAQRRIRDITRVASGPNVMAAAEAVRGFSALADGRADEAGRRFQAAAALYERSPRAILAAELWCEAAQAAGTSSAATTALRQAQRVCDAHGLLRLAARIAAIRDHLSAQPARLPAPLAGLTARERDVVILAADGLSNRAIGGRLYLSEGTVRNYLSTSFGKLGVSRRAELVRLVTTAQLGGAPGR
jgi:DNA-binding CsgD family transcriptional regulator/tetratricopeptide (TPR) repeat protein